MTKDTVFKLGHGLGDNEFLNVTLSASRPLPGDHPHFALNVLANFLVR
jgi:hypothetical protein